MQRKFHIVLALTFVTLMASVPAWAQVTLNESRFSFGKNDQFQILHDTSGTMTIDQALKAPWQPSGFRSFVGYADHPVWMRFTVTSDDATNDQWVSYVGTDQVHEAIDFYWLDQGKVVGHQRTGSTVPFKDRGLRSRFLGTEFQLGVGQSRELVIRIASSSRVFNDFVFESRSSFQQQLEGFQLLFGFHYGLLTILAFISVVQFFSFRDQGYLAYALFCLS